MWLIDTKTQTRKPFNEGEEIEPYAILSHTWRKNNEISFQDMSKPYVRFMKGFDKISAICRQARRHGLDYCWIDTCCIDQSSSAELGEAINSMYKWYREAAICYVWLTDLPPRSTREKATDVEIDQAFAECRWFKRGWTLQELIAPEYVEFYDSGWNLRGKKAHST
jgi:hypothetical protein